MTRKAAKIFRDIIDQYIFCCDNYYHKLVKSTTNEVVRHLWSFDAYGSYTALGFIPEHDHIMESRENHLPERRKLMMTVTDN